MNMFGKKREIALGFTVPYKADPVDSPTVIYGPNFTAIYFNTDDGKYCRATFEKLDSIRVCRGEYYPCDVDRDEELPYCWVSKIKNSSWLLERHEYESKHYKHAYGFGGDVDEMLSDFSHFLFSFHDQYVEVLSSGVWFEVSEEVIPKDKLMEGHPFLPLPEENTESIEAHGLVCLARKNPLSNATLTENAKYCSQHILEFAPLLDGTAKTSMYLSLRYRNGSLCSILSRVFTGEVAIFEGVASLENVKPYLESWLSEISARRNEMGKDVKRNQ